jgi:hypothetical protein
LGELNYANQTKLSFRNINPYEHPAYSGSLGVIISKALNKHFSIGTGIINEQFSTTYFSFDFNNVVKGTASENFIFTGIPIIPDFSFSWKKVSLHFIPEIRTDFLMGDNIKYKNLVYVNNPDINVAWEYNKSILMLACPKLGISYDIIYGFSISAYFGIKQTLRPISNTDRNSAWEGIETYFYSLSGGFGINYNCATIKKT